MSCSTSSSSCKRAHGRRSNRRVDGGIGPSDARMENDVVSGDEEVFQPHRSRTKGAPATTARRPAARRPPRPPPAQTDRGTSTRRALTTSHVSIYASGRSSAAPAKPRACALSLQRTARALAAAGALSHSHVPQYVSHTAASATSRLVLLSTHTYRGRGAWHTWKSLRNIGRSLDCRS